LDVGIDYVAGRFDSIEKSYEYRGRLVEKTMDLFDDYRFFGTGVGNFQYAYPKYQAPEDKRLFIDFAHDDWAQFLAEAGIVGLSLMLGVILYYLFITVRLWQKETRSVCRIPWGCTPGRHGGCGHSLSFGFQPPCPCQLLDSDGRICHWLQCPASKETSQL